MFPTSLYSYSINISISLNNLDYLLENETNYFFIPEKAQDNVNNQDINDKELTGFTDFKVIHTPEYVGRNIEMLQKHFRSEISKRNIPVNSEEAEKAYKTFSLTSSLIAELPFTKVVTELTKSGSIKYTLLFPDNKTLMISKPFDKLSDVDTNQVIFSIFQNQDLLLSNVSEISDLVSGFKEFLPLQIPSV